MKLRKTSWLGWYLNSNSYTIARRHPDPNIGTIRLPIHLFIKYQNRETWLSLLSQDQRYEVDGLQQLLADMLPIGVSDYTKARAQVDNYAHNLSEYRKRQGVEQKRKKAG